MQLFIVSMTILPGAPGRRIAFDMEGYRMKYATNQGNLYPGAARGREGGPSRPFQGEIARKLYRRTPFDEWGDVCVYEKVLDLPIEWSRAFSTTEGWRIVWEYRKDKDATHGFILVRKWPLEEGNVWEETLIYSDGYLLDEDAYR
jgi:hypothetical protein